MIRFAVTHIGKDGLRTLTFGNQGKNHKATLDEAQTTLELFKPSLIAKGILTPEQGKTLEVREVDCYEHGDAKGIYFKE